MKRRLFLILLTGILALTAYGYASAKEPVDTRGTGLRYVTELEGGKLYSAGTIKVVELTGSYRQMGRQYGTLLKNDLEAMHRTIGEVFVKKHTMPPSRLATIARALFDRYPQRYKEILYGIADTSGLGLDKAILVNAVEWLPKIGNLSFGHF